MNTALKELFDDDQLDRENNPSPSVDEFEAVIARDSLRREKAQELIEKDLLKEGQDYFHAAYIFQHGRSADDYLRANEFAKKALDLGYEKARLIYAATKDRYLITIGKPQKYGTQYIDKEGKQVLAPVDTETTDQERALYGIEPLEQIPLEWVSKGSKL